RSFLKCVLQFAENQQNQCIKYHVARLNYYCLTGIAAKCNLTQIHIVRQPENLTLQYFSGCLISQQSIVSTGENYASII
ncbi:hypothetical protein, partial [Kingella oralis]|uniref:hypothetical protein n=1 Tax=Kingella oralis TaxID=505 RepID=UPI0028E8825E